MCAPIVLIVRLYLLLARRGYSIGQRRNVNAISVCQCHFGCILTTGAFPLVCLIGSDAAREEVAAGICAAAYLGRSGKIWLLLENKFARVFLYQSRVVAGLLLTTPEISVEIETFDYLLTMPSLAKWSAASTIYLRPNVKPMKSRRS